MKGKFILTSAMLMLGGAVILFSCKKDRTNNDGDDGNYAGDQARLEQTFDDVQDIAEEAAINGSISNFKTTQGPTILNGCATVTRDTISVPHTVTIDFGPTNCLCNDGRNRRGQILVSYNGHYRDSGSVHTITFNNYYVNDNQVTGTKTVTNMGHNASGQSYFTVNVNGAVILANNAGTHSCTSARTRTWIAGEGTAIRADDIFEITGTASVTRANNKSFTINITTPLRKALNCNWIEQGVVQITPTAQSAQARTLDYGNGNCDNQATITVGNNSHTITLP